MRNNLLLESNAIQINENSTSVDSATFGSLILPLVTKIYPKSLVAQICDNQVLKSSQAKVAALYSLYTGDGSSAETNTHIDNSFLIIVDDGTGLNVDDIITISTSTFTIRYLEKKADPSTITTILLSRETGSYIPIKTDTFGSATVTFATLNRAAIKKLFFHYTDSYALDDNTEVKNLGFETRTETVNTKSRKIKTKFSTEQLQDLQAIYKKDGIELATESIANEVRQEIDKELITYMKFIAEVSTTAEIALKNSYGAYPSGSLQDVSYDLVSNIYLAAERIVEDTKRNRTVFVLADPITAAFLQTNAFHTAVETEDGNPYKIGKLGIYPLFVDLFAEPGERYVLVGYMGSFNADGDSGIIYAPYTSNLITVTDTNFKENVLYIDRYAMVRHPQDTGNIIRDDPWNSANASNSDFFKMFFVSFDDVINYGTTLKYE